MVYIPSLRRSAPLSASASLLSKSASARQTSSAASSSSPPPPSSSSATARPTLSQPSTKGVDRAAVAAEKHAARIRQAKLSNQAQQPRIPARIVSRVVRPTVACDKSTKQPAASSSIPRPAKVLGLPRTYILYKVGSTKRPQVVAPSSVSVSASQEVRVLDKAAVAAQRPGALKSCLSKNSSETKVAKLVHFEHVFRAVAEVRFYDPYDGSPSTAFLTDEQCGSILNHPRLEMICYPYAMFDNMPESDGRCNERARMRAHIPGEIIPPKLAADGKWYSGRVLGIFHAPDEEECLSHMKQCPDCLDIAARGSVETLHPRYWQVSEKTAKKHWNLHQPKCISHRNRG